VIETHSGQGRLSLEDFARELVAPSTSPDATWHASLVELRQPADGSALHGLCAAHGIRVLDTISRQLAELSSTIHAAPGTEGARATFAEQRLATATDPDLYGCWAWFPWMRTIAHVLPPDEYFAVVTNRNQDKITRDEQRGLRLKRVGVVGLSVGGEAAFTVAQEHLCGHIVLADFDELDLSNLNRLGAGVDELTVNKSVITARRIARINPYLAVTLHPRGVSSKTLDAFLDGLDLLVEECDSLPLKLSLRVAALRRGLNVIFAADERGFLSVEPYATHRQLPPFHGLLTEPPQARNAYATPFAFMRALTEWLGGWERISPRSRDSLPRIGHDLCGYPQLASEARFAAGQLGSVARRLLLGEELPPSWQHVDLEQLLPAVAR
jgi:molybdopterin/thiamine biosynthesis adenylyltransferase